MHRRTFSSTSFQHPTLERLPAGFRALAPQAGGRGGGGRVHQVGEGDTCRGCCRLRRSRRSAEQPDGAGHAAASITPVSHLAGAECRYRRREIMALTRRGSLHQLHRQRLRAAVSLKW